MPTTTTGTTTGSRVSTLVGVDAVPERVRALTTLDPADYVDLFTIETPAATQWSPEKWARAVLERSPLSRNARLLWRAMGLRLGAPHSPAHVQGWKIAARGDNWIRVETASWYASAEAVCLIEDGRVSISLSLRYDRRWIAAPVWAIIGPGHLRGVPVMLSHAVRAMS